ncbi:hypothetical protein M2142_001031 [Fusobacterium sp. PH5-29]
MYRGKDKMNVEQNIKNDKEINELEKKYLDSISRKIDYKLMWTLVVYWVVAVTIAIYNGKPLHIFSVHYYPFIVVCIYWRYDRGKNYEEFVCMLACLFVIGAFQFIFRIPLPTVAFFMSILSFLLYPLLYAACKTSFYKKNFKDKIEDEKWLSEAEAMVINGVPLAEIMDTKEKSTVISKSTIKIEKVQNVIRGIVVHDSKKELLFVNIKRNLSRFFNNDIDKLNKLYDGNFKSPLSTYYKDDCAIKGEFYLKKGVIRSIRVYYKNGEEMLYLGENIEQNQRYICIYDKNREEIGKTTVGYWQIKFVGKKRVNALAIPYPILVFHSLLGTDNLEGFVKAMNEKEF